MNFGKPKFEQSKIEEGVEESKKEKPKKPEKIEKLFGHCFEIKKFENNDLIPVGGEHIFSSEVDVKIIGDFDSMDKFFQGIHKFISSVDREEVKDYLEKQKLDIDEELFIPLYTITKALEKKLLPPQTEEERQERERKREELYKKYKNKNIKLSRIVNEKIAECAEIAALAQYALQKENISSSYFSGDLLRSKKQEFSEKHTFIVIHHKGRIYIYDPANPINTTGGLFPNINIVEANFDEEMRKGQKRFVTAKNILRKQGVKDVYYGVNNMTQVSAENIL